MSKNETGKLFTVADVLRLIKEETGDCFPELIEAIHAGEIPAYAPGRYSKPIPGDPSERARLPRGVSCGDDELELFGDDLEPLLKKHFPRVTFRFANVSNGETAAKVGAGERPKPAWVPKARKLGEKWMSDQEKLNGIRPSVELIAKYVEKEFRNQDIRSERLDDYLSWQTIKREALSGITHQAKGDNFRNPKGNPQRKKRSPNVKTL